MPTESPVFVLYFRSFCVPDALFDPLAQFSQLVSVRFRSVPSFSNEPSDSTVSFIDLSFLLSCDLGTSPVISDFSFVAAAFAS